MKGGHGYGKGGGKSSGHKLTGSGVNAGSKEKRFGGSGNGSYMQKQNGMKPSSSKGMAVTPKSPY